MNRRGFLKGAAGLLSLPIVGKMASSVKSPMVREGIANVANVVSDAPVYFWKLVDKIRNLGKDVTETASTLDTQKVKQYKDYELTEDLTTGQIEIQRLGRQSDDAYVNEQASEDVFMTYRPSEKILLDEANPAGGVQKTMPEYEEFTAYVSNNRGNTGEILEEVSGVPDDVLKEVEAGSGNVPESFYTGPNAIKKADGGIINLAGGGRVNLRTGGIPKGLQVALKVLKSKYGDDIIKSGDEIESQSKLFDDFQTRNPDPTVNIPVQQEGKFTKAEYLIQRLENTIKGNPNDKYVQDTFPGFIDELKANPDLAKNENVFKELGGDLPEGQQIVVYGDDSVDFFTQKSGPGNIDRLKKLMEKHNISREKALKIMKMEPNDQVMELKMLEVANRKLNADGGIIGLTSNPRSASNKAGVETLFKRR